MKTSIKSLLSRGVAIAVLASAPVMSGANDKSLAVDLLQRGLVQGDTAFIESNVADDYIQHNPTAPDGKQGLLGFVSYLRSLESPLAIKPVRVLQEGDLVVVHSEYSMEGPKAVFDLFRVSDNKLTEHWDGIQVVPTETASGRSMTDGPTEIIDLEKTAENKKLVVDFVNDVLVNGDGAKVTDYIGDTYHQHNPNVADGLEGLGNFISYLADNNIPFGYTRIHNVVAEGNFVFVQSEGGFGGKPTAFYDLFRVDGGKIVEHWDTVQEIPDEMMHDNGMF